MDDSQAPLAEYGYTLDANGNRTQVVITGSGVDNHTEAFTFDALDRLTNATYGPSANASFTYDKNGNRLTMTTGGQTANYTYDAADQLTAITGSQSHTYTYDDNGNRTGVDADTFGYDWANRLTSATVGGSSVNFAYGGDDSRLSKTTSSTTSYLQDRAAGLPVVVDDGATSVVTVGLTEIAEVQNSTSATTYPLTDALGSVRARVDGSGAVVGSAEWDAWGNVRSSSGGSGVFGWTGEQRDAETGLTYLRARYYAPGSGRFLSQDTVSPNGPATQGYNAYAYALNNPTTFTDPSGHFAQVAIMALASATGITLTGLITGLVAAIGGPGAFAFFVFALVAVLLLVLLIKFQAERNCYSHGLSFQACLQGGATAIGQGGIDRGRSWFHMAAAGVAAGYEAWRAMPKVDEWPPIEWKPPSNPPTPIRPNPPQGGNEPGTGPNPGPGLGPDPVIGEDPKEDSEETCNSAVQTHGWFLPQNRRQHIKAFHSPSAPDRYKAGKIDNGKFNDVGWQNLDNLIHLAFIMPSRPPVPQNNGRCRFTIDNVGYVTGIYRNRVTESTGIEVVYNVKFPAVPPGAVWTAYPSEIGA